MNATRAFVAALIVVASLAQGQALAQSFPAKRITLIVAFPPGTANDVIARALAPKLTDGLGQPVVVDNRVGASGNIGSEVVAKAPADGYTLLVAGGNVTLSFYIAKLNFVLGDFAGVSLLGRAPYTVAVTPGLNAKSMPELVAIAKAKPGSLNGATGGAVSVGYFMQAALRQAAGVNILSIDYKGTSDAIPDLIANRVQMMFAPMVTTLAYHKSGQLRIIAITGGAKRNAQLPDVATLTETGYAVLDIPSWAAIVAPSATPRPVITRLNADIVKAMRLQDVQDQLFKVGVEPATNTPEEMDAYMKADYANWGKIIRDAGVTAPQ